MNTWMKKLSDGRGAPRPGLVPAAAVVPPAASARTAPAPSARPGRSRVAASPDGPSSPSAAVTGGAPRGFWSGQCGSATIGAAIAISILVTACGGLMAIAHAAYTDDRMSRAARAAAQAIALGAAPAASEAALASAACDAIRRELDLDPAFDCADSWTLTVKTNLSAAALASGAVGNTDGKAGEMILVEIGWARAPWARAVRAVQGAGGPSAVGLARSEPVS